MSEFRMDLATFRLLNDIAREHGREAARVIWEQAEADAIAAGEDHIDRPRMQHALDEYLAQE